MFGELVVGLGEGSEIAPPMAGTSVDGAGEGVEDCGCGVEDAGLGIGEAGVMALGVGEICGLAMMLGKTDGLGSRLGTTEAVGKSDGECDGELEGEFEGRADTVGEGVVLGIFVDVGNGEMMLVGLGSKLGTGTTESSWAWSSGGIAKARQRMVENRIFFIRYLRL